MRRSTINQCITRAHSVFRDAGIHLPPFAFWTPIDWEGKGHDADEIRDNALGWDITDFGLGDFQREGLILFTIRNGSYHDRSRYPKPYAEKVMLVDESQVTPMHCHWKKREDIINRAGGRLVLELYRSSQELELSDEAFSVSVDGVLRVCAPGERIILNPGESISIEPLLYHTFYGESGHGPVIVGEVSSVNDDLTDNRFLSDSVGRFPKILEDEKPVFLLCTEYPPAA